MFRNQTKVSFAKREIMAYIMPYIYNMDTFFAFTVFFLFNIINIKTISEILILISIMIIKFYLIFFIITLKQISCKSI